MDYFLLSQDPRIFEPVEPVGVPASLLADALRSGAEGSADLLQFYIKPSRNPKYIDFIAHPVPLVTDRMKAILGKYDPGLVFRPVVLADLKHARQELYWLMLPKRIACLSKQSRFKPDRTLGRVVLDPEKLCDASILMIDGILEHLFIVRLDVAESLLRRSFSGIRLKKVECESKE